MRLFNLTLKIHTLLLLSITQALALPLSPVDEPKADSFYICYAKRCLNNYQESYMRYTRYKYIGCVISKVPCHLYCGDKDKPLEGPPGPLKQFQWMNNYPDALNSFYRCAYS